MWFACGLRNARAGDFLVANQKRWANRVRVSRRQRVVLLNEKQQQRISKTLTDMNKMDPKVKASLVRSLELAKATRIASFNLYEFQVALDKKTAEQAKLARAHSGGKMKERMGDIAKKIREKRAARFKPVDYIPDEPVYNEYVIKRVLRILNADTQIFNTPDYLQKNGSVFEMKNIERPYYLVLIYYKEEPNIVKKLEIFNQLAEKCGNDLDDPKIEPLLAHYLAENPDITKDNISFAHFNTWHKSLLFTAKSQLQVYNEWVRGVYYEFDIVDDPYHKAQQQDDLIMCNYQEKLVNLAMATGVMYEHQVYDTQRFVDAVNARQREENDQFEWVFFRGKLEKGDPVHRKKRGKEGEIHFVRKKSKWLRLPKALANSFVHNNGLVFDAGFNRDNMFHPQVTELLRNMVTYYDGEKWVYPTVTESDYEEVRKQLRLNFVDAPEFRPVDYTYGEMVSPRVDPILRRTVISHDWTSLKHYKRHFMERNSQYVYPRVRFNEIFYPVFERVLRNYTRSFASNLFTDAVYFYRSYPKIQRLVVSQLKQELMKEPLVWLHFYKEHWERAELDELSKIVREYGSAGVSPDPSVKKKIKASAEQQLPISDVYLN